MWDLDSDDGSGSLSSGGDIPCPKCNLGGVLNAMPDQVVSILLNETIPIPPHQVIWALLLKQSLIDLHGFAHITKAAECGLLTTYWFGDQKFDNESEPVGRIAWPYPLHSSLLHRFTAHERLEILSSANAIRVPPEFLENADGLWIAPPLDPKDPWELGEPEDG